MIMSSDSALDSTCNGNGNTDHHQSALASIDERQTSSFAATKHTELKLGSSSTSLGTAARRYSRRVSPITAAIRQKLIRQCEKTNENIQQLTINKLQYASVGMVGRERETKVLQSCLERLNQQQKTNKRKELVFIKGYSGVGKSTLAYTLEKIVTDNLKKGIFVHGKFHFNNRDEPYSGIADAFGEICRTIMIAQGSGEEKEGDLMSDIGNAILSELGSEVELLAKVIPELVDIVPQHATVDQAAVTLDDFNIGRRKWKNSFRLLTRVLNSFFCPMVLLVDDLQWADVSSLELIDSLLSDTLNSNGLMIVGCYRSNEVDDAHILSSKIKDLEAKKDKYHFNITDIELGSFQLDNVNKVLAAMLAIDDDTQTKGLAKVCFKRTHGNPFFLIEFVTMLEEEKLISYNLGLLGWMWEETAIGNATVSTANVADLLQAKMRKLPKNSQLLLQYAACLGSSFSLSTLDLIWDKHATYRAGSNREDVTGLLTALEERDFIESRGVGVYRWVHDKVQEAALLLGDAAGAQFQFEIGIILYHWLSEKNLEDQLFDVVNLINKRDAKGRPEFAELNLRAAEKAKSISAFQSASKYVSHGIKILPSDAWTSHRTVTLRLYNAGAQIGLALGNQEAMDAYGNEVLCREDCSILDKLPVYLTKTNSLSTDHGDAVELSLTVLKELGYRLMWNRTLLPTQAFSSLLRTIRMAKKTPKDFYTASHRMTDPKQRAAMLVLGRLFGASYLSEYKFTTILTSCRMVQMTRKNGVNQMSGVAFATLGLLTVAILGDIKTATQLAETALLVQELAGSKFLQTATVFSCYVFVLSRTQPLQSCFTPLLESFSCGMRSGNTECAMWSLSTHHGFLPYTMGKPLESILATCSICASQAEELKNQDIQFYTRMLWQVILNLMGESSETMLLKGAAFDCEEFVPRTSGHRAFLGLLQSELLIYFGEFEHAAELAISKGNKFERAFPGHFLAFLEMFQRGVALYAMARQTKKRKYGKPAKQIQKTITKWVKNGNPNVLHYRCFFNAEQAALDGKCGAAEALYKKAIVIAGRSGHLHHAALFNERYADFLLQDLGEEDEAKYRIGEAIRFYKFWGAEAKVKILTKSLS
jgi:histidine kinase